MTHEETRARSWHGQRRTVLIRAVAGAGSYQYRLTPALWRSALTFSSTDQPKTDPSRERTRDPAQTAEPLALARTRTHGDPAGKYRNAMLGPASVATREDAEARIAGQGLLSIGRTVLWRAVAGVSCVGHATDVGAAAIRGSQRTPLPSERQAAAWKREG
jgi:hypothetical protein